MIFRLTMIGLSVASLTLGVSLTLPETATAQAQASADQSAQLRKGDVLIHQDDDGWSTVKIIAIDSFRGGKAVVHCLLYAPVSYKPEMRSLAGMQIIALHAPISAAGFQGWERIGSQSVTKDEAAGFIEYLKTADFSRYTKYTGQNLDRIISKANGHYNKANALGDAGRRVEAIAEYDKAIDLFPLFYEAIDNRAFKYMELGNYDEALAGFERSLSVNPDGVSAFFSKGECLMKLGKLDAAETIFAEGQARFPEERALFTQFLDRVRALRQRAN